MFSYDSLLDQYHEIDLDDGISENGSVKFRKSTVSILNALGISRIIKKSGRINTFLKRRSHKNLLYIKDLGYTLLSIKWRWILLTLFLVNFVSFVIFAIFWMTLAHLSGDFEEGRKEFCVVNTKTFTGYMLLSIETITTIGYGYRYPTENCKKGWILLTFQALFSVALQGALVSAIYVKISKPFTRVSNSLFSKNAVICLRDGQLNFVFRIHDFTSKIWCGTTISLYFVDKENDSGTFDLVQMKINPYGLLLFPLEIEHEVNEESPLWNFSPADILQKKYEIVAVAEGSSVITGQVSQNRTSYTSADILWGHRFCPCVSFNEDMGKFEVNYKKFKQTYPFDTPLCSAKDLKSFEVNLEDCRK